MNFLALCRRACVECGVASGSAIQTALPTTVGATGSLGRVVNWVGDAWNDVQMAHDDWDWMRSSNLLGAGVSFPTVAGQASYQLGLPPGGDFGAPDFGGDFTSGVGTVGIDPDLFGKWDRETFRSYPTAVGFQGEDYLDEIPFDAWRNRYMFGANRLVQTRPVVIAVGPDQSLNLGPPSNGLYTVTGDYFVAPSVMVADTDTPVGLPTRFHMLIVYEAMVKYAGYESAPEVSQRGSQESTRLYAQLQAVRAPRMSFGGALA
jgi:hypothetical protein